MSMFQGYVRANGSVGVRNYVLIIPTVTCAVGVAKMIEKMVPGTIALEHGHGCGRGPEIPMHERILTNIGKNPNTFAAIYIGLGCEMLNARKIAAEVGKENPNVFVSVIQEDGGSKKVAEEAAAYAREMVKRAAAQERQPVPFSKLTVGLECGGSDALSGITANPSIGYLSDWLAEQGGRTILTETTEFLGTKDSLGRQGADPEVCKEICDLIDQGERYAVEIVGPQASRVISKGNMEGGMSTIQEKSLGCIRKAGYSPVQQVLEHGEIPTKQGLCIMDGPGFDTESMTGLVAGGAQICIFSTGRGNPIGHPCCPVVKVASNSRVFHSMPGDMDINAGVILEGKTLKDVGDEVIEFIKAVANGQETAAERNGQGGVLGMYAFSRAF